MDTLQTLAIEYNDCWLWRGSIGSSGYGIITRNGRTQVVHRLVYQLITGDIPTGLELDHLCKNKICVRPEHLEPVTRTENMRRRYGDKCSKGHLYSRTKNQRRCIPCAREYERKNNYKRKEYLANYYKNK